MTSLTNQRGQWNFQTRGWRLDNRSRCESFNRSEAVRQGSFKACQSRDFYPRQLAGCFGAFERKVVSAKATFWAWEQEIDHPPTKLVLVCLADSAGDHNNQMCWPSVRYIAKRTGLCHRAVQNAFARLEALGFLKKHQLYRENGSCTTNLLELLIPDILVPTKSFGAQFALECPAPGAFLTPPGAQHAPPHAQHAPAPGAQHAPLESKSIESEIEPAQDKPSQKRARNDIFDALAELGGINSKMNRASAGRIAKAKALILESSPDVTVDEIKRRADTYRKIHPTWTFTPMALATNWDTLGATQHQDTKQQILSYMP